VGADGSATIDFNGRAHLTVGLSAVRATLTDSDEALPRIPPVSARLELEIPWKGLSIGPEIVFTARQGRVFREETPTEGSTVLNFGATYFLVRGHATHTVALRAYNLTNAEYRSHTSFIKDLAPEMGRGVRVTYAVKFF
jgi:iron complex outermembrane receptor protein